MDKWEKQMKKMSNKEIPDLVSSRVTQTLESLPRKKRFTKLKYGTVAAVLTISILTGASLISPAFAETLKSLPFINSITELIDDVSMENGYEQGISVPIDKQYTIDGKKVLFTDVIYDGTDIYIGYLVSKAPLEEQQSIFNDITIRVDGKSIGYIRNDYGELTDDMFYAGRLKVKPAREQLPDQFELQLLVDGVDVKFNVEKKGNTEVYTTTESKRHDSLLINYKSVSFTPTATQIRLDEIARSFDYFIDYLILDDKGRVLQEIDSSGFGIRELYKDTDGIKKAVMETTISVVPLNEKPAYLTIKPYIYPDDSGTFNVRHKKWEGEMVRLSQGELGDILVKDVVQENGNVSVYFETTSVDEFRQGSILNIQDESGKDFISTLTQIGIHQYKKVFKDFPSKSDIILTSPQVPDNIYLKDLEVTIPIEDKRK